DGNAAGVQRPDEGGAALVVDAGDPQVEGGGGVGLVVVHKDGLGGDKAVLLQQQLVDGRVRLGELCLAGGDAAVEQGPELPLADLVDHVLRNVGQIVDGKAHLLQPLDHLLGFAAGLQHTGPVVQHALYLEGTAGGSGFFQHQGVTLGPAQLAGVQQQP